MLTSASQQLSRLVATFRIDRSALPRPEPATGPMRAPNEPAPANAEEPEAESVAV
jgi:hypothetical protein